MTRRHRAFREPTLDSSKVNVRFSFQGPRQQAFTWLLGVANHSRRTWQVNYFLSHREDFSPCPVFVAPCGASREGANPALPQRGSASLAGSESRSAPRTRTERLALPVSRPPEEEPFVVGGPPSVKGRLPVFSHRTQPFRGRVREPGSRGSGARTLVGSMLETRARREAPTVSRVVHMWMVGGECHCLLHEFLSLRALAPWGKRGSPQAVPIRSTSVDGSPEGDGRARQPVGGARKIVRGGPVSNRKKAVMCAFVRVRSNH